MHQLKCAGEPANWNEHEKWINDECYMEKCTTEGKEAKSGAIRSQNIVWQKRWQKTKLAVHIPVQYSLYGK